jgi:hypothetical protein
MSQPTCEPIVETIQKLTQDLYTIDDELHALEVEGMNQQHPWGYVVLQRQVDRLNKEKHALQDAWNRAMNELAICRSNQPSPRDPRLPQSHWRSSARTSLQTYQEGRPATYATALVQAAIQVWEEKDASALASYLSDDVICKQILPQPVGKAQLIAFMEAITTAFPDWSFNGHVLHEESLTEQSWSVLYVTAVTGTQTGDLILPTLPGIPATGRRIILPYRHLEFLVVGDRITAITADFSPSGMEEVLEQLGLELP